MRPATHEQAVRGADVVCACTGAVEVVVRRERCARRPRDLGRVQPARARVDDATVADALLVVESRESALAPAPAGSTDLDRADRDRSHRPRPRARGDRRAGCGHAAGPGGAQDQLTLYKSVGVAVQDAAAAALVLGAAREREVGREVEI